MKLSSLDRLLRSEHFKHFTFPVERVDLLKIPGIGIKKVRLFEQAGMVYSHRCFTRDAKVAELKRIIADHETRLSKAKQRLAKLTATGVDMC